MATKPTDKPPEAQPDEADVVLTEEQAAPADGSFSLSIPETRYVVRSAGVSLTSGGAAYTGEEVSAAQLGDAARIRKLLAKGSIEEVA